MMCQISGLNTWYYHDRNFIIFLSWLFHYYLKTMIAGFWDPVHHMHKQFISTLSPAELALSLKEGKDLAIVFHEVLYLQVQHLIFINIDQLYNIIYNIINNKN